MTAISLQGFKRYFANTSWLMVERVFRMFAWVFLFDLLVRSVEQTVVYLQTTGKVWYWKWRGMVISIYMKISQLMIKEMLDTKQFNSESLFNQGLIQQKLMI